VTAPARSVLLDAVFEGRPQRRRHMRALGFSVALALHAGLWLLSRLSGPSLETWSARVAAMVHRDLRANAPTAIETPEPKLPEPKLPEPKLPEPKPEPPEPARAEPARAEPTRAEPAPAPPQPRAPSARPQPPAAPAAAAQVIAAEPDAPVDLTADTFVTGTASAYAGGATTARGTNTQPVSPEQLTQPVAKDSTAAARGTAARPVSLTSEHWRCPWPAAALAQDLYEQSVIVRAWVRADGSVEQANVVDDPGNGFGAAAIACALRTRFNPARNARGEALRALSPPIRVRFTR
jgi:periplasmic protein TonB